MVEKGNNMLCSARSQATKQMISALLYADRQIIMIGSSDQENIILSLRIAHTFLTDVPPQREIYKNIWAPRSVC